MEITLGKCMEGNMKKQAFITEEESRKCRKVAEAFTELYENDEQIETPEMENMGYNEIIRRLPQEKQEELLERKEYFLQKCRI